MSNFDLYKHIDKEYFDEKILPELTEDEKAFFDRVYDYDANTDTYRVLGELSASSEDKIIDILKRTQSYMVVGEVTEKPLKMGEMIDVETYCEMVGMWLLSYLEDQRDKGLITPYDANLIYAPAYPEIIVSDFNGELKEVASDGTITYTDADRPASPQPNFGNVITWEITDHDHASIETQPGVGRRPKRHVIVEEIYNEETDKVEIIKTIWWDNFIQFDCFAKTQTEANKLRKNFEALIMTYGGDMGKWGLSQTPLHWGWVVDNSLKKSLRVLKVASFKVYVRTEQKFKRDTNVLEHINLIANRFNTL